MSAHRQGQADVAASQPTRTPYVPAARQSYSKQAPPPPVASYAPSSSAYTPAPPPYIEPSSAPSIATKRAPPPPPAPKPRPKPPVPTVVYVTALYDYSAQAEGDLSFSVGDKIELVKRGDSVEDWWTGRIRGEEGVFPGNYVQ